MKDMKNILPLAARFMLGGIFLNAGIMKAMNPTMTMGHMESAGMFLVPVFFAATVALEILGPLAMMVGFKAKWAALALFLFLIPVTAIFHHNEFSAILKNVSLMGGLLMVYAFGPGELTIDRKLFKK